jgi:hypothetical protein
MTSANSFVIYLFIHLAHLRASRVHLPRELILQLQIRVSLLSDDAKAISMQARNPLAQVVGVIVLEVKRSAQRLRY